MEIETSRKIFILNLVSNILFSFINMSVSFFLTPYLTNSIGSEAFGFVGLANNMINYISIITVALNSVAGRFITIKMHEGKTDDAAKYFNSVFGVNIILAIVITIVSVPIIINLEHIIKIPGSLVTSVRLLFVFVLINYLVNIITNIFTVSTFVCNKLYITNVGNCLSGIIRVGSLILLFSYLPTEVYYVGFSSLAATIFLSIYNYVVTKKLIPALKISLSNFSAAALKILFASGIWNSVIKLTQVLSDGLDLLISNLGISTLAMGQLSIAYTVPNMAAVILGTIVNVFSPKQTYYYAKNDIKGVVKEIKTNMKLSGFLTSIIFSGIVTYGYEFYSLYVPRENIQVIYNITLIRLITLLICGVASCLDNIFLITNKLKVNSIAWLLYSIVCFPIILILVKFTDLGIYAIAGVSKVLGFLMYVVYVPIYASKSLKISFKTFYPMFLRYFFNTIIITVIFVLLKRILPPALSIPYFVLDVLILFIAGCIFNYFCYLNKSERIIFQSLTNKVRNKFNSKI